MTRDDLIALLDAADPLDAVARSGRRPPHAVQLVPAAPPREWLVDDEQEGAIAAHRAAHAAGRPSEAIVRYGAGTTNADIADRLLALAELADETGLLRAVRPEPGEGSEHRPGSWGIEDLTIVAAARAALPDSVMVLPSWDHIGAGTSQVAAAFGATAWRYPDGASVTAEHLAESVGATLTEGPR